jgi:Rho GDP-dissociation inhibitor
MSNVTDQEDDLTPSQTAGYKVGEKKTIHEYKNLDADDESLAKWKASLGLDATTTGKEYTSYL